MTFFTLLDDQESVVDAVRHEPTRLCKAIPYHDTHKATLQSEVYG